MRTGFTQAFQLRKLVVVNVSKPRESMMNYRLQEVLSAVALIALGPIFSLVALSILVLDGRPIFYRALRLGAGGSEFTQFKFRSMVVDADLLLPDELDSDAPPGRITRIGHWLRITSIDELPQLWNIVRGEMALVGPRPLLPEFGSRVPSDHPRFTVRPGLTGLAQVSGRNKLKWSVRLSMDEQYAAERSLLVDVKILLRTIKVVFFGTGLSLDRNAGEVLDV